LLRLCSFSTCREDLDVINGSGAVLKEFLAQHRLDGLELMICGEEIPAYIPVEKVYGVHLSYWPTWLDFWCHNSAELQREFGSAEQVASYYGSTDPKVLVERYRHEIGRAVKLGAKYAVFHVSHARKEEVFSYRFHYDDAAVVTAAIELLNAVFAGFEPDIEVLLENLWWPGLTFLQPQLVEKALTEINFQRIGLMLDTGHLMNTNLNLASQRQGIEYVLQTVENLGSLQRYIRGVHLHYSLSGNYVRKKINEPGGRYDADATLAHVLAIDQHLPFSDREVRRIIDRIQPGFLVHEFTFRNREKWSEYIRIQNEALGF